MRYLGKQLFGLSDIRLSRSTRWMKLGATLTYLRGPREVYFPAPKFRALLNQAAYRHAARYNSLFSSQPGCCRYFPYVRPQASSGVPPFSPLRRQSSNMSAERVSKPASNTNLGISSLSSDTTSLSLWERLSVWASENKAVVYTIAGVAVVASGAGVAYYISESRKGSQDAGTEEKKRLSKKERRKAKQEKEKEKSQPEATVTDQKSEEQSKDWIEASSLTEHLHLSSAGKSSDSRV